MIDQTHEITVRDKHSGKLGTITVRADGDWLYRRLILNLDQMVQVSTIHQRRADPPLKLQPL